jgi:hypothetical protein
VRDNIKMDDEYQKIQPTDKGRYFVNFRRKIELLIVQNSGIFRTVAASKIRN